MRPPLQVSLNGSRGAAEGAAVPMSPEELVEAALGAVAAGAGEVLVHPRTPCGWESLSPRVVGPVLEALRDAGTGLPVVVPAGVGAEPDPAGRLERVRSWTVLPDRAAVHFGEPGAEELARALLARGVAVDAVVPLGGGVGNTGSPGAAGRGAAGSGTDGVVGAAGRGAAGSGTDGVVGAAGRGAAGEAGSGADGVEPLVRFLAWPAPDHGRVRLVAEPAAADPALVAGLRWLPPVPVLLCGRETAAWPVLRLAARCGAGARIGLGDVLHLPDGRPARSNAELVAAAVAELAATAAPAGAATAGSR
ncbi:3-keto-5-aminohexanoate cleavage protein [Streptomyces goshikiensis]|uniref:3-keto-5-aminohexanoate cleavage protein n=1 Tax=Streptomyces goshikiensis TaxID=1942 RepID=UPI0037244F98